VHDEVIGADERFSRIFGDNVRRARTVKGWSQRRLAEALDIRGVKLDPSAVTRIERGAREVKLREAAAIAQCLEIDIQELITPAGREPLAVIIQLLKSAADRMHAGRSALAEMASYLRAVEALLSQNPELVEDLRRLRGFDEDLDVEGFIRREIHELTSNPAPEMTIAVDDRMLELLQDAASAAAEKLFTNNESEIAAARGPQSPDQSDAKT
jgi:transcriptional regulator with XRE-family HTH domain